MILVEMDSVAILSVRQETVADTIFIRGQKGHYFRISIPDIAPPPLLARVSLDKNSPLYSTVVTGSSGLCKGDWWFRLPGYQDYRGETTWYR